MLEPRSHTSEGPLRRAARQAGFRSVQAVRVVVDGARATAEVTGVIHRYPHTVPVTMSTARRLATAGAPVRIEHREASS